MEQAQQPCGLAALDAAIAEFGADPARQYLTGMSMGGYGSWNIALDNPHRFAAIVPVCGAVLAPRAVRPTLFVEQVAGETDPYAAIARACGRRRSGSSMARWMTWCRRMTTAGCTPHSRTPTRVTCATPEGNHNAWDATYADPAMWEWMFAQKR